MKISFFVPRCIPDNSHGRYVIELAKRFSSNHQVTIYSGAFSQLPTAINTRSLPVPNRPAIGRLAYGSDSRCILGGLAVIHTILIERSMWHLRRYWCLLQLQ